MTGKRCHADARETVAVLALQPNSAERLSVLAARDR